MYCLKKKGALSFGRPFKTEAELDAHIQKAFVMWRGAQPRGSDKTIEDFMATREKVKVTIERI